ncbi:cyclin-dependent kinase 8-like [Contarinia nasturtii]|uniref:cyclin-dependent kinase 8-like n=1 Tax=Contarinia nasturtii TaxID=265458 RepID=UPI0012D37824|nr:cyclin-dependent kinase 8-like [Contarinia nasturtii]
MDYYFVQKAAKCRQRVYDDYAFNENVRIGRGSYGQVYKAREIDDENGKQNYALKEVELTHYSPSTFREIALYREIKHPNIIDLLKVYFSYSHQKAWLLFDYAEYDLHSMIKFYRNTELTLFPLKMPYVMKKSCLYQILLGVKYLHDNWILHRDLKPENIMVMGEGPQRGCIKIADMGMARIFHAPMKPLGDVDTVVVTSWYRAPELLLASRHYTKAIDMFSIGCIFAEILTNLPIFASTPETNPQPVRSPYQKNQLDRIFSVMGYPTLASWPELKHIPEYTKMTQEIARSKYAQCSLAKYMKAFNVTKHELSFHLLSKMLVMDPKKRISTNEALGHKYFTELPHPTKDVFHYFNKLIPFPPRKYLSTKIEPPKFLQKERKIRKASYLTERNI